MMARAKQSRCLKSATFQYSSNTQNKLNIPLALNEFTDYKDVLDLDVTALVEELFPIKWQKMRYFWSVTGLFLDSWMHERADPANFFSTGFQKNITISKKLLSFRSTMLYCRSVFICGGLLLFVSTTFRPYKINNLIDYSIKKLQQQRQRKEMDVGKCCVRRWFSTFSKAPLSLSHHT